MESSTTGFSGRPSWKNFRAASRSTRRLTTIDGTVHEDNKVTVGIEGLAAGREPRAAAEELRQLLLEQLGQSYGEVKVEFKSLEDLDTIVNIGGSNLTWRASD